MIYMCTAIISAFELVMGMLLTFEVGGTCTLQTIAPSVRDNEARETSPTSTHSDKHNIELVE